MEDLAAIPPQWILGFLADIISELNTSTFAQTIQRWKLYCMVENQDRLQIPTLSRSILGSTGGAH